MKIMTKKEFVETFYSSFAKNVLKEKLNCKKKNEGLLWDIFALKLIPCYNGEEARKMFDSMDKKGAMEIKYTGHNNFFKDDEFVSNLSTTHTTAKDIDDSGVFEFYVIGENFNWCYVVTHEFDLCGPYFCFKQQ